MIPAVIGLPGLLLDDETFRIARSSGNLSIHIIFPVAARRKPVLSILEITPSDIARERHPVPLPNCRQQIIGLLGRRPFELLRVASRKTFFSFQRGGVVFCFGRIGEMGGRALIPRTDGQCCQQATEEQESDGPSTRHRDLRHLGR